MGEGAPDLRQFEIKEDTQETRDAAVLDEVRKRIDIENLSEKLKTVLGEEKIIESLGSLLVKLRDQIKSFDSVISDDSSGRLVALFMKSTIENATDKNIPTYFVQGRKGLADKREDFLTAKKDELGKTLVVTEFIEKGSNIKSMMESFEKLGVDFSVASAQIKNPIDNYNETFQVDKLTYGQQSKYTLLYRRPEYSGVIPDPRNVHPKKRLVSDDYKNGRYEKSHAQQDVNDARADIQVLVEELSPLLVKSIS